MSRLPGFMDSSSSGAYFRKVFLRSLCITSSDQSFVWDRNKIQFVRSKAVLRPKVNDLCNSSRNVEVKNY